MQSPRRTKLRHQADLETSQLLLKQLALSRNCVNAIQQPLRQGHPDQSTCANVEQLLARALPYLELAPTLLLCIRGELHDCLRAAALRLCGQHAYAHNHATQARGEACPGYSRDPPQQSHLQRNAQFLDDIFVGDVPRLRSTAGRNVKTAAHLYPVRGASYSSLPRENCDLGRPRTSLALFFAFNDFVADPTRRPFILPFDAARRGPPADDPLDDPPRGE